MGILIVLVGFNTFIEPEIENSLIYLPYKEIVSTPKDVGLIYEDIVLETKDKIKINGWYMDNPSSNKVILFFHGNGGNISLYPVDFFYNLPCDYFVIDYRGYGKSESTPSDEGLYLDGEAAYDFLKNEKKYTEENIIAVGWSLGGFIASYIAANHKVGGLVLMSSLTSSREQASKKIPAYLQPFIWLKTNYNTLINLENISSPVLVIHGENDEMVPFDMGRRIFQKANEPKYMLSSLEGKHNDIFEKNNRAKIAEFISEHLLK